MNSPSTLLRAGIVSLPLAVGCTSNALPIQTDAGSFDLQKISCVERGRRTTLVELIIQNVRGVSGASWNGDAEVTVGNAGNLRADCPQLGFFPRATYTDFRGATNGINTDVFFSSGPLPNTGLPVPQSDGPYAMNGMDLPGDWGGPGFSPMDVRFTLRDSKELSFEPDGDGGFHPRGEELATSNTFEIPRK